MPGRQSPEEKSQLKGMTVLQYQLKKMPAEDRLSLKKKIQVINKRLTSENAEKR